MKKARKQILEEKKSKILAELFTPDCVISQLAKTYEVSESVLYKWRRNGGYSSTTRCQNLMAESNFIELLASEVKNTSTTNLQKISLTFNDFVLSIDGTFSSAKLTSIIEILEESC